MFISGYWEKSTKKKSFFQKPYGGVRLCDLEKYPSFCISITRYLSFAYFFAFPQKNYFETSSNHLFHPKQFVFVCVSGNGGARHQPRR